MRLAPLFFVWSKRSQPSKCLVDYFTQKPRTPPSLWERGLPAMASTRFHRYTVVSASRASHAPTKRLRVLDAVELHRPDQQFIVLQLGQAGSADFFRWIAGAVLQIAQQVTH